MNRAGSTLSVQSVKDCVVYEANGGVIHHHHRVLTLVGGREPSKDEMAADALRAARARRDAPAGDLHVLHVEHDAMRPGQRYRVDHANKTLIDLPLSG